MPKNIIAKVFALPGKLFVRAGMHLKSALLPGNARSCPLCGHGSAQFLPFGFPERADACCFFCGSLERHRFLWLYLKNRSDFFSNPPGKLLHFAPEPCLESRLRKKLGENYITADIEPEVAMIQLDITAMDFPDHSFDAIFCSHVLEHVSDDGLAMRELHRVLKPSGWALLVVPISGEKTFEDATVTDPAERLRLFGQEDHVRIYGADFADRLHANGFTVERITPAMILSEQERTRYGIPAEHNGGDIYRVGRS